MSQVSVLHQLLSPQCVRLDLVSKDKPGVLRELVDLLDQADKLADAGAFLEAIENRESANSTGLEQGVAIPHAQVEAVREPAIAIGISRQGIDFDALDGQPSRIFLMIAEPFDGDAAHLEILARVSSRLIDPGFRKQVLAATSAAEIIHLFDQPAEGGADDGRESEPLVVVAVTSCPVGVSHTYLAAERLRHAARQMGIRLLVETHGSVGVRGRLSAEDISGARSVILAVDRKLDTRRFSGKPLVETWVTDAIRNPRELLSRAIGDSPQTDTAAGFLSRHGALPLVLADLYRHVMAGFSTILPFVIAGGIVLSLASLLESWEMAPDLTRWMTWVGADGAFALLAPILAGFIGRAIAGRVGLMPAAVGGALLALDGAGLIGGVAAGLLCGYGMLLIGKQVDRVGGQLDTIKAVLLLPLLSLLLSAGGAFLLGPPLAAIHDGVAAWLAGLGPIEAALLGAVLGALMAIDMGGPVNKIAYSFGIVAIGMGYYPAMAALMAGGMVPPLGIGAAAWFFASDAAGRRQARRCLFKGVCFVTEGVIPMIHDNGRQILVAGLAGATLSGALSMAFGCELRIPHGGLFVAPLVGNWPMYLVAIGSGALLTAVLYRLLHAIRRDGISAG